MDNPYRFNLGWVMALLVIVGLIFAYYRASHDDRDRDDGYRKSLNDYARLVLACDEYRDELTNTAPPLGERVPGFNRADYSFYLCVSMANATMFWRADDPAARAGRGACTVNFDLEVSVCSIECPFEPGHLDECPDLVRRYKLGVDAATATATARE
jgi:hypothetical protein